MEKERVRRVLEYYRYVLVQKGATGKNYPHSDLISTEQAALDHCLNMIDKVLVFIQEDRMDKVFRWLGFLQGVLWMQGVFTLEDVKNHNWKEGKIPEIPAAL